MIVLLSFTSCKEEGPQIIPRNTLSEIYAEMLLTDQWIVNTSGARSIADTSLVYKPILEQYGYTLEDYQHTVNTYLDEPNRFAKIFARTENILNNQLLRAKEEKKYSDFKKDVLNSVKDVAVPIDTTRLYPISKKYFFNIEYDPEYRIDSIVFEADSLGINYSIKVLKKKSYIIDTLTVQDDTLDMPKDLLGGKSIEEIFPVDTVEDRKNLIRKAKLKELSLDKDKE